MILSQQFEGNFFNTKVVFWKSPDYGAGQIENKVVIAHEDRVFTGVLLENGSGRSIREDPGLTMGMIARKPEAVGVGDKYRQAVGSRVDDGGDLGLGELPVCSASRVATRVAMVSRRPTLMSSTPAYIKKGIGGRRLRDELSEDFMEIVVGSITFFRVESSFSMASSGPKMKSQTVKARAVVARRIGAGGCVGDWKKNRGNLRVASES